MRGWVACRRRTGYARLVSRDRPHVFAHIDMDAFYVSVELQRRPELRGKPVVVAGSGPRAVVTTASYEARRFGIYSATPAERARRACPQAIFIAPDFDAYRERSRDVMDVLRAHVERVEVVGLDEAYLDLSEFERPARRRPARQGRGDGGDRARLLDRASARASWSRRSPPTPRSRTASSRSAPRRRGRASPARPPGCCRASAPRRPSGWSGTASRPSARSAPPPTSC